MSRDQKISLFSACVFYVLTITGFFFFSLTLIILVFLGFSLSIVYFASLCYRVKQDYTGAEHLQQEIGILTADKEQMKKDYEALLKEKDEELEVRREAIDNITLELDRANEELKKAEGEMSGLNEKISSSESGAFESLLPPDDDDDTANVDIIEICNRAIKELEADAKRVGLRITVSSASDRLMVKASAKRLLIMFRNIIDNSIKYMQREGSLVVTISAIEDDIFIVLKDTGKGLPENETKHIFELNYQGSNRISGNGLGLTQAKAIVEHYGGTIYARSPQGNGMGIYIQLPTT